MKKTYAEKLRDPRWQKKRLEIMQRDNFACRRCFARDVELHVHHVYYAPRRDPWSYDKRFLLTLCKDCHAYMEDPETKLWMAYEGLKRMPDRRHCDTPFDAMREAVRKA